MTLVFRVEDHVHRLQEVDRLELIMKSHGVHQNLEWWWEHKDLADVSFMAVNTIVDHMENHGYQHDTSRMQLWKRYRERARVCQSWFSEGSWLALEHHKHLESLRTSIHRKNSLSSDFTSTGDRQIATSQLQKTLKKLYQNCIQHVSELVLTPRRVGEVTTWVCPR